MERPYHVVLAGNPNVGKSTVFNALTKLRQHTGNWTGKTVSCAQGRFMHRGQPFLLTDAPGTYSLSAVSPEETYAVRALGFTPCDAVLVVCDATCLARSLFFALEVMQVHTRVVVCLNLMDEATARGVAIDVPLLEKLLGVPVVPTQARDGTGLSRLCDVLLDTIRAPCEPVRPVQPEKTVAGAVRQLEKSLASLCVDCSGHAETTCTCIDCSSHAELRAQFAHAALLPDLCACDAVGMECPGCAECCKDYAEKNARFSFSAQVLALHLLAGDAFSRLALKQMSASEQDLLLKQTAAARAALPLDADVFAHLRALSQELCVRCVRVSPLFDARDRQLDRLLTGKITGFLCMGLLLLLLFYITLVAANKPAAFLQTHLLRLQAPLLSFLSGFLPENLAQLMVCGVYRVTAWVVSVMLPPMAVFFPLFTLLEDMGFLPRMAFNLDRSFSCAGACGKQALTMCMGLGCNAVGVTGCRIIDSPRERLIAILTNVFIPCNGRLPTLIALITLFFVGAGKAFFGAAYLSAFLIFAVLLTLLVSKLLSKTLLRGEASAFALELPPYRRPQFLRVLVRSMLDRTAHVLLRAVVAAAPAGALIWLLAHVQLGGENLLAHLCAFLDPFGALMGLDGAILAAFLLGLPANEIVLPILLMLYTGGDLAAYDSLGSLYAVLAQNGFTAKTALHMAIFTIAHFPCATTCLTIKKETGSFFWTALAFLLPTVCGILLNLLLNLLLFTG